MTLILMIITNDIIINIKLSCIYETVPGLLLYMYLLCTWQVYVRDCTMVSVYPLLLFGGGSISIDLDRGNFVLSVDDGWIRFMAASNEVRVLLL